MDYYAGPGAKLILRFGHIETYHNYAFLSTRLIERGGLQNNTKSSNKQWWSLTKDKEYCGCYGGLLVIISAAVSTFVDATADAATLAAAHCAAYAFHVSNLAEFFFQLLDELLVWWMRHTVLLR